MKILNAAQIREWDQYTITHEPVSSIDLMERAAQRLFGWIREEHLLTKPFYVFCGTGNNGGDGLALARMLGENGSRVHVVVLGEPSKGSADFAINLQRLQEINQVQVRQAAAENELPGTADLRSAVIIDAIFGSGLNKPPTGVHQQAIALINSAECFVISVDLPSGMYADSDSPDNASVKANTTLTLQLPKLAFFLPTNTGAKGKVHVLDIGLHTGFKPSGTWNLCATDTSLINRIYKPRSDDSHKGTHGHALLVAGSYGKMGAAVLAASACLRTGAGLLTCHIPASGYSIMQTALPEAMVITDYNPSFNTRFEGDVATYTTIGIGPGLGTASETITLLRELLERTTQPMVIDADALNIISRNPDLFPLIPAGSILTPHPKEFERLFGDAGSDADRIQLALDKARELNCVIVLKGHHTLIATPGGEGYFNTTGNGGLAKGGTGDTLTGIIMAMLAQGYTPPHSAILAVYLHGLSADLAVKDDQSEESLLASDLILGLGKAFKKISGYS